MNKILSIFLMISFIFSQFEFTEEELNNIYNKIDNLSQKDSLNQVIIGELELNIKNYELLIINKDELIKNLEQEVEIKNQMIKVVKPKWYDNKYLWFGYGVAAIIVPIWGIGQIK